MVSCPQQASADVRAAGANLWAESTLASCPQQASADVIPAGANLWAESTLASVSLLLTECGEPAEPADPS